MSNLLLEISDLGTFLKRVAALTEHETAEDFSHAIDPSRSKKAVSPSAVEKWFSNKSRPDKHHRKLLIAFFTKHNICKREAGDRVWHHYNDLLSKRSPRGAQRTDTISASDENYISVGLADLDIVGWTLEEAVAKMFDLDHAVYDDLTEANEGTASQWLPVYKHHPQSWRMIVKGNRLVGYWHIAVFLPDFYQSVKQGLLMEGEIDPLACYDLFELPGIYNLYAVSVCLSPEFRTPPARSRLLSSFLEVIDRLSIGNVFFSEVLTNGYSEDGLSVCRSLRMRPFISHKHSGTMYIGSMGEILERFSFIIAQQFPSLIERYKLAGV